MESAYSQKRKSLLIDWALESNDLHLPPSRVEDFNRRTPDNISFEELRVHWDRFYSQWRSKEETRYLLQYFPLENSTDPMLVVEWRIYPDGELKYSYQRKGLPLTTSTIPAGNYHLPTILRNLAYWYGAVWPHNLKAISSEGKLVLMDYPSPSLDITVWKVRIEEKFLNWKIYQMFSKTKLTGFIKSYKEGKFLTYTNINVALVEYIKSSLEKSKRTLSSPCITDLLETKYN